jgi:hypothetical protein
MSEQDIFILKVYVLLSPFLLLLTLFLTIRVADWMERREERRRSGK